MKVPVNERIVQKAWVDPKNPAAFRGVAAFAHARKIKNIKQLKNELKKIDAFTVFKRSRTKIKRRPIILKGPLELIQIDLADMSKLKYQNSHYSFIFVAIDVFTKKSFAIEIKNKGASEIVRALTHMLKFYKGKIQSISHDQGLEFLNSSVKKLLKEKNISQYHTYSPLKAQTVERFIKTLKQLIWRYFAATKTKRWVDVLDQLVSGYNLTRHSAHNHVPAKIKPTDVDNVAAELYKKFILTKQQTPKYKPGDFVRISNKKIAFQKAYKGQFSEEIFVIEKVHSLFPTVSYKLKDQSGNQVDGSFVEGELSHVIQ